jgi:hypothetical protein
LIISDNQAEICLIITSLIVSLGPVVQRVHKRRRVRELKKYESGDENWLNR